MQPGLMPPPPKKGAGRPAKPSRGERSNRFDMRGALRSGLSRQVSQSLVTRDPCASWDTSGQKLLILARERKSLMPWKVNPKLLS